MDLAARMALWAWMFAPLTTKVKSGDGEMVLSLKGLPWRPKPDEPLMDEVPTRFTSSAEAEGP